MAPKQVPYLIEIFIVNNAAALNYIIRTRKNVTHIEKKTEKNIKDGNNGTKIGASNIVGGNQLRYQISAPTVYICGLCHHKTFDWFP